MSAPKIIRELVLRYENNRSQYHSGKYNEAQLRREFLDPLLESLGWDVFNKRGYSEVYKEVIHEDSMEIAGENKAPDYAFRIGGVRKFLVEAKRPAVSIETSVQSAFQLRRYAWSAKLPLGILTDFEEFAVYDCRIKPDKADKVSKGRILLLNYTDYLARWDEIEAIFSREAVLKGSFDKYAEGLKGKRGTTEVDEAFLIEIERWRELLAKNIALRNGRISVRELNYAVQMTIDRIVFLRICEDRGIEREQHLKEIADQPNIYFNLCALFKISDTRYNSGLFHFTDDKDQASESDSLTLSLKIDDKALKEILLNLYYPESPYVFKEIPSDILGQVYERFLGKVIRLTSGHQAKVEEKPEVRKAGGVYYTPTYIVDYIVRNTIEDVLNGKRPADVSRLKILDPACGSGTFLIGAYQYLLDWHLRQYSENNPEKFAQGRHPSIYSAGGNEWRLTSSEKKRILLNNIHGVDIDPQAVEVTKLSLLLKVLEGESQETIGSQLALLHERVLPDLGKNIQCGNSLIGSDYYAGKQLTMLVDEEERYRVNVFDWQVAFPEIFVQGGFGVVIGNPPYIQLSMAEYYNKDTSAYFLSKYSSTMGRMNTFGLFIEKSLTTLLSRGGSLSFIVPNTILTQEGYQALRRQLLKNTVRVLTNFRYPVFRDAVVETIVFVVAKGSTKENRVQVVDFNNKQMSLIARSVEQKVFEKTYKNSFLSSASTAELEIKQKIDAIGSPLKSLTLINQAIALKHDRSKSLYPKRLAANYKSVLDGRNINRYVISWDGTYLAYDIKNIHSCKRTDIFESNEKIFFRRVGDRLVAAYDNEKFYALNTLVVINLKPHAAISTKYLLGLINSKLLNFYYVKYLKSTKRVFSEIQARQLSQLPIKTVDFDDQDDASRHGKMVALVDRMLLLNKEDPRTPQAKEKLKRELDATDKSIDELVYELYGLTDREVKLVELGDEIKEVTRISS
ncbi:MAG: TaqI-like C-terminal specificity domain-containing protein [Anaerolineales bacterium]